MFSRTRARRERIEGWVAELGLALPRWLSHFSDHPDSPNPSDPEFARLNESVIGAMSGIRFNARFPLRRRKRVVDEIEDLSARVVAVHLRYQRGIAVTTGEMLSVQVGPLREAVLGKRHRTLEESFQRYVDEGIPIEWE